tara:strand:- start:547 stop:1344 length:798 start_codon:yes stop_codon:yes gene_type:complete
MYKLYRQQNGQVQQVPVNTPEEDTTPPNIEEAYPNPLQAKGEPNGVAPFVLQEKKQFDLIKQNESQQAKFQTSKLQNNNYQILNFKIVPTDSTASQAYYVNDYNDTVAVGSQCSTGVEFGTDSGDVGESKYYNIVYANARLSISSGSTPALSNPCYIEFYPLQKVPKQFNFQLGGKIPRQQEVYANSTGVQSFSTTGDEYGVQSFGIDVFNENAYYTQSPDLKGIRCCGVALKRINLKFESALDLANLRLDVELGYDLRTEGNNY